MTSEDATLSEIFDNDIQVFTMCEKCNELNWCVVNDIGFELCRGCYSGESLCIK